MVLVNQFLCAKEVVWVSFGSLGRCVVGGRGVFVFVEMGCDGGVTGQDIRRLFWVLLRLSRGDEGRGTGISVSLLSSIPFFILSFLFFLGLAGLRDGTL